MSDRSTIKVYTQDDIKTLRHDFVNAVKKVFDGDVLSLLDYMENEELGVEYDIFCDYNNESYIINRSTGEYINWYKLDHVGRDIHSTVHPDYFVEFLTEFKKNQDNLTRRISND